MQNNQTFAFTRGYYWGIKPIIRKPHIICAVILVNPCCIHVHDIIPCFPKRFDLSQIITPIIDNVHLLFFVAFSLLKKANNFFTNFWHYGNKSDFLPILQKMQNITIIYERNACQVHLKYTWPRERFYR
jgi:hypothetical protein